MIDSKNETFPETLFTNCTILKIDSFQRCFFLVHCSPLGSGMHNVHLSNFSCFELREVWVW